MPRSQGVRVASLALALAVPALAQEPKGDGWKWDPAARRAPVKGERTFDEGKDSHDASFTSVVEGKRPEGSAAHFTVTYRVVREVTAVAGDLTTGERISVERWSRVEGDAADTSLEGRVVTVTRSPETQLTYFKIEKGTGRDWPDVKTEAHAREWVAMDLLGTDKHVTRESIAEDLAGLAALGPGSPVAADAPWTVDPAKAAKALYRKEVDAARSSVEGKLTGLRVENGAHVGKVALTVKRALAQVPEMAIEWSEGGVLETTLTLEGPLEGASLGLGKLTVDRKLVGKADDKPGGRGYRRELSVHTTRESTSGLLPPPAGK